MNSWASKHLKRRGLVSSDGDVRPGDSAALSNARKSIRRKVLPLSAALTPTENNLHMRISEELEYARRGLDLLGDELVADHLVVARHSQSLQNIDRAGQILGYLSVVIRSQNPSDAVAQIGMTDLRSRLLRTSL